MMDAVVFSRSMYEESLQKQNWATLKNVEDFLKGSAISEALQQAEECLLAVQRVPSQVEALLAELSPNDGSHFIRVHL